jgi:hypothetical protein
VHITDIEAAVLACPHRYNSLVRKVDLTSGDHTVTTIAGSVGAYGFSDGKAYSPALPTDRPHKCLQPTLTIYCVECCMYSRPWSFSTFLFACFLCGESAGG